MFTRALLLVSGLAAIVATGVLHGIQTDRWRDATDLAKAAAQMQSVPLQFGDWNGEELVMEDDLRRAGIQGHLFRIYRNLRTGKSVNLLLLMGRPGPISVHTPDVCYAAAGYLGTAPQQRLTLDAGAIAFPHWLLHVRKQNSEIVTEMDIRWSWYNGEKWQAPGDEARFTFAKNSCLYKLYLLRPQVSGKKDDKYDSLEPFLTEFLPRLEQTLLTDFKK